MVEEKNLRIIFTEKAEEVFDKIVEKYGLQETDEEFENYLSNDIETREMVLRDTVSVLVKNLIPEKRLLELLKKYLEINEESASNIVKDIKKNLLPSLLVYPEEKFEDSLFREEIAKKIFAEETQDISLRKPPPVIKEVEIRDVEKSAERLRNEGKRGQDVYRETIE